MKLMLSAATLLIVSMVALAVPWRASASQLTVRNSTGGIPASDDKLDVFNLDF